MREIGLGDRGEEAGDGGKRRFWRQMEVMMGERDKGWRRR